MLTERQKEFLKELYPIAKEHHFPTFIYIPARHHYIIQKPSKEVPLQTKLYKDDLKELALSGYLTYFPHFHHHIEFKLTDTAIEAVESDFKPRSQGSQSMLREDHKQILKQLCEIDKQYSPKDIYFNTAKYVVTTIDGKQVDVVPVVKTSVLDLEALRDEGLITYRFDVIEGSRLAVRSNARRLVANDFKEVEKEHSLKEEGYGELRANQKAFLRAVYNYLIVNKADSLNFNHVDNSILVGKAKLYQEFEMPNSITPDDTDMHLLEEHGYIQRLVTTDTISSAYGSFTKDNSYEIKLLPKALNAVKFNFTKTTVTKSESSPMPKPVVPIEITESYNKFRAKHGDKKTCFIMMKFQDSAPQLKVLHAVVETLAKYGIVGLRVNYKKYNKDLLLNIKTYMHGCDYGIVIFDKIVTEEFNPNVSYELGYMDALGKEICLLSDKRITKLHSDLAGLIFNPYDSYKIETVAEEIEKWLKDIDILNETDEASAKNIIELVSKTVFSPDKPQTEDGLPDSESEKEPPMANKPKQKPKLKSLEDFTEYKGGYRKKGVPAKFIFCAHCLHKDGTESITNRHYYDNVKDEIYQCPICKRYCGDEGDGVDEVDED